MEAIVETWELLVWRDRPSWKIRQHLKVSWRWCSETTSTPTKGSSELDWSSDLPNWRPQTQIWVIMILVMWTFGVVTLTLTSHAASIPWPWQMCLKCLPWAFTKDLDLSCDWRPQTQIWVILVLRWKRNTALLLTTKVEQ